MQRYPLAQRHPLEKLCFLGYTITLMSRIVLKYSNMNLHRRPSNQTQILPLDFFYNDHLGKDHYVLISGKVAVLQILHLREGPATMHSATLGAKLEQIIKLVRFRSIGLGWNCTQLRWSGNCASCPMRQFGCRREGEERVRGEICDASLRQNPTENVASIDFLLPLHPFHYRANRILHVHGFVLQKSTI